MKKAVKILLKSLAIIVVILVALILLAPTLFKETIKEKVVAEVNQQVDALVTFDDFSLTFIRNFPNLTFRLEGVSIVGKDRFEGDTLAGLNSFGFVFDISSIFGKEGYTIRSIVIDRPVANAIVLEDGTANWDIVSSTAEAEEVVDESVETDESLKKESKELKIQLKKIEIRRALVSYIDKSSGIKAGFGSLDLTMSGNFSEKISDILVDLSMKNISLAMNGESYLDNMSAGGAFNVTADLENNKYTLKDNSITVNDLVFIFDGEIMMAGQDIGINLDMETGETRFKSLLSLVPSFYMNDYRDLNADGSIKLSVSVNGTYSSEKELLPDVGINLEVHDGSFSYGNEPDLLSGLNIDLLVNTSGEEVNGNMDVNADLLNLSAIMNLLPSDSLTEMVDTTTSEMELVEIPSNIDFELTSSIGHFVFTPLVAENIGSHILVKDSKLTVDNSALETLGGRVSLDALYSSEDINNPFMEASIAAEDIGIKNAYESFNTIRRLAPVADGMDGTASVKFEFSSALQQDMMPDLNSINGAGHLESNEIEMVNSTLFGKFSTLLKLDDKFSNTFNNLAVDFRVEDGRVYFKPFNTKLGNIDLTVGGDHGLDQTLNYLIASKIPASDLPGSLNILAAGLAAQAAMFGIEYKAPEVYNVNVGVTGSVKEPQFKPSLGEPGKGVKDGVKETVTQVVKEKVEEVRETVKDEVSRQAEKIMAEAENQAEIVKSEAGKAAEKIRDEAAVSAQKLIDEAASKGPLARMAAKKASDVLINEADKKAAKLEEEADVKAEQILDAARKKVDGLG